MPVEQRRVVRRGRRSGRAPGSPSSVTGTSTTSPADPRREAVARHQSHGDEGDRHAPATAKTPSCSTTPPTSQTAASSGCWPSRGRAATTRRTPPAGRPDRARDADRPHHATPPAGRPTWSAAPRAGRGDEPAGVAVVERQRLAVELERQQRVRVVGRSCPPGCWPARRRAPGATRRARRCPRARRPGRAGRAPGRRSRCAPALQPSTQAIGSDAVVCGIAAQVGQAQQRPRARRTPPSAGTSRWWRPRPPRGRRADLLIGTPCRAVAGPDPEHRHLPQPRHGRAGRGEHRDPGGRPGGAQQPAPRQHAGVRGCHRRAIVSVPSTSDVSAGRMTGSFTATCTSRAPMAIQATRVVGGAEVERPGVPLGGVRQTRSRAGRSRRPPAPRSRPAPGRAARASRASRGGRASSLG